MVRLLKQSTFIGVSCEEDQMDPIKQTHSNKAKTQISTCLFYLIQPLTLRVKNSSFLRL